MPRERLAPGEISPTPTTRRNKTTGRWYAEFRVGIPARPPQRVTATSTTRQDAITRARAKAEHLAAQAPYLAPQAGADLNQATPGQLWALYQETPEWNKLADKTRYVYSNSVRASQAEDQSGWWELPIQQAAERPQLIRLLKPYSQQHGKTPTAMLKAAVKHVLQQAPDAVNPDIVNSIRLTAPQILPKRETKRLLTPEQLHQLKALTRDSDNPGDRAIWLNTYLGMRAGDLLALTWENYDPATGTLTGYSVKTRHPYPPKTLPDDMRSILEQWSAAEAPTGPLFPVSRTTLDDRTRRRLDEIGCPWATMHTIRKTVGSIVFDHYGVRAAASWLAHKNISTTMQWYIQVADAAPSEAVPTLNF